MHTDSHFQLHWGPLVDDYSVNFVFNHRRCPLTVVADTPALAGNALTADPIGLLFCSPNLIRFGFVVRVQFNRWFCQTGNQPDLFWNLDSIWIQIDPTRPATVADPLAAQKLFQARFKHDSSRFWNSLLSVTSSPCYNYSRTFVRDFSSRLWVILWGILQDFTFGRELLTSLTWDLTWAEFSIANLFANISGLQ